jgi:sporulation protein YlmC with PRC-barrel domain
MTDAEGGGFVSFSAMKQKRRDLGHAVHYSAVTEGTAVFDSEGAEVGTVRQVVDNYREHILDGLVIEDEGGTVRFVDGPEVSRTYERGVHLTIDAEQVARLGPPEDGPGTFRPSAARSKLGRLFNGGWRKH